MCRAVRSLQMLACRYKAKRVGCIAHPMMHNSEGRLAQCVSPFWPAEVVVFLHGYGAMCAERHKSPRRIQMGGTWDEPDNRDQQHQTFFFHEYGRRVGMVPRSSLKEGKYSQMVEKRTKTTQQQKTTANHSPKAESPNDDY